MLNDESRRNALGSDGDDFEAIQGIGPKFAEALQRIGIHRYADFAEYTSDQLAQMLFEQTGVRVSPQRIESQNWIGQATALTGETQVVTWRQQAGFSLFFDYMLDGQGEPHWQTRVCQTRVYHEESGSEELFPGIEPLPWVEWILRQADLPAAVDAAPLPAPASAPAQPTATAGAKLEILEPHVAVLEPGADARQRRLAITISFRLVGGPFATLASDGTPYQVEIHLTDLHRGVTNLVSSQRGRLQLATVDYSSEQVVEIPAVGRYELQSIVFLLPPGEALAVRVGPALQVLP